MESPILQGDSRVTSVGPFWGKTDTTGAHTIPTPGTARSCSKSNSINGASQIVHTFLVAWVTTTSVRSPPNSGGNRNLSALAGLGFKMAMIAQTMMENVTIFFFMFPPSQLHQVLIWNL